MTRSQLTITLGGLVALLVLAGQTVAGERPSVTAYVITLRPDAVVTSKVIRLSDIATITGPSRNVCEHLGRLDIEDAPAASDTLAVSSLQLEFRLRLTGISQDVYRVHGNRCVVRTSAQRPTPAVSAPPEPSRDPLSTANYEVPSPRTGSQAGNGGADRLRLILQNQIRQLAARSPQKTGAVQQVGHSEDSAGSTPGLVKTSAQDQVVTSTQLPDSPRERIVHLARTAVLERLPWDRKDVQIDVTHVGLKSAGQRIAKQGTLIPEIRSAWPPVGRVQIVVQAIGSEGETTDIPVILNVRYFQSVVVAARRIARGAVITKDDVYMDRQEVRDRTGILTSSESAVGMTAGRDIMPLNLIRPGDVRNTSVVRSRQPLVRRGATVNLIARGGGLAISVQAEAMQDGRPGDVIRVRNLDSKQIRTGKVISANEVEVAF